MLEQLDRVEEVKEAIKSPGVVFTRAAKEGRVLAIPWLIVRARPMLEPKLKARGLTTWMQVLPMIKLLTTSYLLLTSDAQATYYWLLTTSCLLLPTYYCLLTTVYYLLPILKLLTILATY